MKHELKIFTEHFNQIWNGTKKCEIRKNDRDFKVHDALILREYLQKSNEYTNHSIWAEITHIIQGGQFGLDNNYCVLSIVVIGKATGLTISYN